MHYWFELQVALQTISLEAGFILPDFCFCSDFYFYTFFHYSPSLKSEKFILFLDMVHSVLTEKNRNLEYSENKIRKTEKSHVHNHSDPLLSIE